MMKGLMNIKRSYLFFNCILISILSNAQQPQFEWAKSIGGNKMDYGISIALDDFGNSYTIGTFSGTADFNQDSGTFNLISEEYDIFITKLNSSGNFVWAKKIGGKSNDFGQGISSDKFGNIYATGRFEETADFDPGKDIFNLTSAGGGDIFVLKLDSSGNFIWAKKMGGFSGDIGYSLTVDDMGCIYSTGFFSGTADFDPGPGTFELTSKSYTVFVSKLNPGGDFVWAKKMGDGYSQGLYIGLNKLGNVYTAGWFTGMADFDPGAAAYNLTAKGEEDIFISKLDNSGKFVWATNIGSDSGSNHGYSLVLDKLSNIYITGYFEGSADFDPGKGTFNLKSNGSRDIFILKLDSSGNFVWAKTIGGNLHDAGYGISIDLNGDIYTTGCFQENVDFDPNAGIFNLASTGGEDVFILKLDSKGDFVWAKAMGGDASDWGLFVKIDKSENIYTTGWFQSLMDCDPGPSVLNLTSFGNYDIFIHKMGAGTIGIKENIVLKNLVVYPNPTNSILNIDLQDFHRNNIKIQLLNSIGQLVLEEDTSNQQLTLNIQNIPAGLYFIRIISDNIIQASQKIMKQ